MVRKEFFLVHIFPYSDWIRRFTEFSYFYSKYGKIRTRKKSIFDTFLAVFTFYRCSVQFLGQAHIMLKPIFNFFLTNIGSSKMCKYWKTIGKRSTSYTELFNLKFRMNSPKRVIQKLRDAKVLCYVTFEWPRNLLVRKVLYLGFAKISGEIYRSSRQRCFVKKDALRNFTKFTGKCLCQTLFFDKVAGLRPTTIL